MTSRWARHQVGHHRLVDLRADQVHGAGDGEDAGERGHVLGGAWADRTAAGAPQNMMVEKRAVSRKPIRS